MALWPRYPSVFEINTWVWLAGLSEKSGVSVDLGSVAPAEWDTIAERRFDAVWLMGVWERSPAGIAIANHEKGLLDDFQRAPPDFRPQDNVGSPYSVRRYVVDKRLGGPDGLAVARQELAKRRMRLILNFVPNHVAPDHPWVVEHPEYFIWNVDDTEGTVFACGRDPCSPAWPDVLQLNAFQPRSVKRRRKLFRVSPASAMESAATWPCSC